MSTQRLTATDLVAITSRKLTADGYMIAPGNLARAGNVQEYHPRELGLKGDKIIRLFRPPEEVFHAETLASFDSKPLTLGHPPKNKVDASNWRQTAVGDVRDVAAKGEYVEGTLIVRDKAAVLAIVDGKSQLSCGYDFDFDKTPGTTADGQAYDGVMRKIVINHHAIVDTARGGVGCRVADQNQGDRTMRKIVVDGISIELEDTQASIVEKVTGDANARVKASDAAATVAEKRATDAETALAASLNAGIKLAADHAAVVADLTAKILKPEQIEAIAAERAKVVGDAALLCPELKPAGKTIAAIRAEVLTHVLASDEALKPVAAAVLAGVEPAKAAEPIARAAFDAVVAARGTRAGDDAQRSAHDAVTARAFAGTPTQAGPAKLRGRDLFIARMKTGFAQPAAK